MDRRLFVVRGMIVRKVKYIVPAPCTKTVKGSSHTSLSIYGQIEHSTLNLALIGDVFVHRIGVLVGGKFSSSQQVFKRRQSRRPGTNELDELARFNDAFRVGKKNYP